MVARCKKSTKPKDLYLKNDQNSGNTMSKFTKVYSRSSQPYAKNHTCTHWTLLFFFALMDKLWLWLKERNSFLLQQYFFNVFAVHKILKDSLILNKTRLLCIVSFFVTLVVLKKLCYSLHVKMFANINLYPSIYGIMYVYAMCTHEDV